MKNILLAVMLFGVNSCSQKTHTLTPDNRIDSVLAAKQLIDSAQLAIRLRNKPVLTLRESFIAARDYMQLFSDYTRQMSGKDSLLLSGYKAQKLKK